MGASSLASVAKDVRIVSHSSLLPLNLAYLRGGEELVAAGVVVVAVAVVVVVVVVVVAVAGSN